jgi:hypothetical protein
MNIEGEALILAYRAIRQLNIGFCANVVQLLIAGYLAYEYTRGMNFYTRIFVNYKDLFNIYKDKIVFYCR